MKKWISLILSVVIFITSTMTFSYADEGYKEGFIECYNMNNSKKYECPIIVEDDTLYMDAEYISKISSYSIDKMEGTLDFYKDTNKSSAINRISVHLNEEIASYYSCNNKYDLENIIIKDEVVYLPLEKMLYLMHAQWTVKSGVLGVQTPIYDLYDFIESEFGNITQNMVKDGDILIDGESSIGRSIRAALSTVVDDFSLTLFIPFYGGQKFEQDQYEKVLLGLCQDDSTFLDNTSKKNVEKLLESSPIENVSKSYDSLGRFLELQDNLESSDNFKDAFKSINIFDARCIDFDMSIPVGDIIGGGITVWKAVSEANELENRSKQWTRDYMNQIKALANADLSPYGDASYMKNARSVARKLVKEKEGKYNKALEKTLNTIVEQDLSALISLTIAGSLVNVISIGTDVTKMLNPNAEEGLNRGKLSGLLKSTANISAIAYNEVEKYHNLVYWSPNKDETKIEGLRSSLVLLLRSNLRAKEYIYYLKSDDKWDYRGEEKDLKRRIEKDYALICKLSETARYDKALEVDSDFKSIYSEENGKYRVNILESGINIFEKYEVTGKVVNKNGNSLEGVSINFINDKTDKELNSETDSNGNFSQKLKSGAYTLEISKDGYETKEMTVEVNGTQKDLGEIILSKEQNLYKNYVGYWGYTKECITPGMGSTIWSWEVNIKSINGNNIVFDYVDYLYTGESLGLEGKNIKSVINNGKVEFTCLAGNLNMPDANKQKSTARFYLRNGKVYVDNTYQCDGFSGELVKGGKTITKTVTIGE